MISFSVFRSFHTVIVVVMSAFLGEVCAGQNSVTWIKALSVGEWPQYAKAVAPTDDGGMIVVGYCRWKDCYNQVARNEDGIASKYDAAGSPVWSVSFGGQENDRAVSVSVTPDGGCVVTGTTRSIDGDFEGMNEGVTDAFVLSLDAAGRGRYLKTLGGSGGDCGLSIIATDDGGCCVSILNGSMDGDVAGMLGKYLIKLNSDGDLIWRKKLPESTGFGPLMFNEAVMLRKAARGNIILCTGKSDNTLMLEELSEKDGKPLWSRVIGGPSERVVDVCGRKRGGCLVLSVRGRNGQENRQKELVSMVRVEYYDSSGRIDVAHEGLGRTDEITDGDYQWPMQIVTDGDENAIVSYRAVRSNGIFKDTPERGLTDIGVCSINRNGEVMWVRRYGGSKRDGTIGITLLTDQSIVCLVGTLSEDGNFSGQPRPEEESCKTTPYYIMKLDPAGQLFPPSKKVKKW